MRAKRVYEFHQTGDPLKSLELGKYSMLIHQLEDLIVTKLSTIFKTPKDKITFIWKGKIIFLFVPKFRQNDMAECNFHKVAEPDINNLLKGHNKKPYYSYSYYNVAGGFELCIDFHKVL